MAAVSAWISALVQVLLFLLVPFIWWLVTARGTSRFFGWLGWHRPQTEQPGRLVLLSLGIYVLFLVPGTLIAQLLPADLAVSAFHGLGWAGLLLVIPHALIQTAFAEESLFRGFLLKRLAAKLGFHPANIIQAALFGALHALLLGIAAGLGWGLLIGAVTGLIGWSMGYVNERLAGGSLIPSWALHAAANLTTGCLALIGVL